MGFLQSLALQAGQSILFNQQQEATKLENEYKKQQIEKQKMQINAEQQKAQRQQQLSKMFEQMPEKADAQSVEGLRSSAGMFQQAAKQAIALGDFDEATKFENMAQSRMQEAKALEKSNADGKLAKQEDLSKAAWQFLDVPGADTAAALTKSAIAAGVDPKSIPLDPSSPDFLKWADAQSKSTMTAEKRVADRRMTEQFEKSQEEKKREFEIRAEEKRAADAAAAQSRRDSYELKKFMANQQNNYQQDLLKLRRDTLEARTGQGSNMGKKELSNLTATVKALGEFTRQWENQGAFGVGTTLGTFVGLGDKDVSKAFQTLGARSLTPDQSAIAEANAAGMAKNLSSAIAASENISRGFTVGQVEEMKKALSPRAGESGLVSLFKYINAAEEASILLQGRTHPDPATAKMQAEMQSKLSNLPVTSKQIIEWVRDSGDTKQLRSLVGAQKSVRDAVWNLKETIAPEDTSASSVHKPSPSSSSTPPLPPGATIIDPKQLFSK